MSISSNFPVVKPSLLLDFANTKKLDPRITFTRASTATYYDEDTVAKAEENLVLQSQAFENASWTKSLLTVSANTVAAPDGTTTAETITCTASTGSHEIYQGFTFVSGSTYTMSVFVKKNTNDFIQLRHYSAAGGATRYANFNVATGVLGTVGADATASITDAGNGWYRCVMIAAPTGTSGGFDLFFIDSATATSAQSFTAGGTESVYIWGAQLEQRSAVTAYTPTTTASITNYAPTMLTAAVDAPRFDHNPTTRESLGLLIEEQRTNLMLQTENPTVSPWAATVAGTSTRVLAGWNIGFNVFEITSTSADGGIRQSRSGLSSGQVYTLSFYMQSSATSIVLLLENGAAAYGTLCSVVINGSTGGISSVNGFTSTSSIPFANGYFYTFVLPAAGGWLIANVEWRVVTSGQRIFLGRPQLEAGAFATSYITTVASSVTRSADAASMTGTNFSSWFKASEGTLYADSLNLNPIDSTSNAAGVLSLNNASSAQMMRFDPRRIQIFANSVDQANITTISAISSGLYKSAFAYAVNNIAISTNASAVGTDTNAILPLGINRLQIGIGLTGSGILNGTIKKIAYYPWRLTNAQLRALTS